MFSSHSMYLEEVKELKRSNQRYRNASTVENSTRVMDDHENLLDDPHRNAASKQTRSSKNDVDGFGPTIGELECKDMEVHSQKFSNHSSDSSIKSKVQGQEYEEIFDNDHTTKNNDVKIECGDTAQDKDADPLMPLLNFSTIEGVEDKYENRQAAENNPMQDTCKTKETLNTDFLNITQHEGQELKDQDIVGEGHATEASAQDQCKIVENSYTDLLNSTQPEGKEYKDIIEGYEVSEVHDDRDEEKAGETTSVEFQSQPCNSLQIEEFESKREENIDYNPGSESNNDVEIECQNLETVGTNLLDRSCNSTKNEEPKHEEVIEIEHLTGTNIVEDEEKTSDVRIEEMREEMKCRNVTVKELTKAWETWEDKRIVVETTSVCMSSKREEECRELIVDGHSVETNVMEHECKIAEMPSVDILDYPCNHVDNEGKVGCEDDLGKTAAETLKAGLQNRSHEGKENDAISGSHHTPTAECETSETTSRPDLSHISHKYTKNEGEEHEETFEDRDSPVTEQCIPTQTIPTEATSVGIGSRPYSPRMENGDREDFTGSIEEDHITETNAVEEECRDIKIGGLDLLHQSCDSLQEEEDKVSIEDDHAPETDVTDNQHKVVETLTVDRLDVPFYKEEEDKDGMEDGRAAETSSVQDQDKATGSKAADTLSHCNDQSERITFDMLGNTESRSTSYTSTTHDAMHSFDASNDDISSTREGDELHANKVERRASDVKSEVTDSMQPSDLSTHSSNSEISDVEDLPFNETIAQQVIHSSTCDIDESNVLLCLDPLNDRTIAESEVAVENSSGGSADTIPVDNTNRSKLLTVESSEEGIEYSNKPNYRTANDLAYHVDSLATATTDESNYIDESSVEDHPQEMAESTNGENDDPNDPELLGATSQKVDCGDNLEENRKEGIESNMEDHGVITKVNDASASNQDKESSFENHGSSRENKVSERNRLPPKGRPTLVVSIPSDRETSYLDHDRNNTPFDDRSWKSKIRIRREPSTPTGLSTFSRRKDSSTERRSQSVPKCLQDKMSGNRYLKKARRRNVSSVNRREIERNGMDLPRANFGVSVFATSPSSRPFA